MHKSGNSNFEDNNIKEGHPPMMELANVNHHSTNQNTNQGHRNSQEEPLVSKKPQVKTVGEALTRLQGNMRYQKIYVFFLILVFICGNRFLTMYPFLQLYPNFKCLDKTTNEYYACTQKEACSIDHKDTFQKDEEGPVSLNNWMTALELYCYPRYEIGLMGTFLFVGQTIGALLLTHWADIFGRKKTMMFHGSIYALIIFASTFAGSITQVYVFIFFIGLFFVPRSSCIFTYIMEITPDKFHEDANLFVYIGDGLTFVISGVFVKYTRDPFLFLMLLCIVTVISVVVLTIFLPESPKFLYSKGRYEELQKCFEQVQRTNKVPLDVSCKEMVEQLKEAKKESKGGHKSSFVNDLRILYESPEHRNSLIAVLGIWIYSSFNYYLIGYYVKYFPGDIFTNFLMMTVAEVIAPLALRFVQGRFSTKYVVRYLLLCAAGSAVLFMVNQYFGSVALVPIIILLVRVFVKGIYSLGYYANGKLFPTLVKTSIFSLTNGIGRPFSALSTMVTEYTSHPGEIFLGTAVAFLFVSYLLPESDNTEQELEKIREMAQKYKQEKELKKRQGK